MEDSIILEDPIIDIDHKQENLSNIWTIPLSEQIVDEVKHIAHIIAEAGGEALDTVCHDLHLDDDDNDGFEEAPPPSHHDIPPTKRRPSQEAVGDLSTLADGIVKMAGNAVEGVKDALHSSEKKVMGVCDIDSAKEEAKLK